MKNKLYISFFLLLLFSCSPKTTQVKVEEKEVSTPDVPRATPCFMFSDATDPEEAIEAHVIYRDFLKEENFEQALKYWTTAYKLAPAADGQRDYHFTDGIKIYSHYYKLTVEEPKKDEYWAKIQDLYLEASKCYPQRQADYFGSNAFNLYYNFSDRASKIQIYKEFTRAIDIYKNRTPAYIMNPFTDVLIELIRKEQIPLSEGQKYADYIQSSLEFGIDNSLGRDKEAFQIVDSYVPGRMKDLETVRGFYDCHYYIDTYYSQYMEDPESCESIRTVISRLKWGNCSEENEKYITLLTAYKKNCQIVTQGPVALAYECLKNADYSCAIENFNLAITKSKDPDKQAKYTLVIAKIYYAHLRNFPQAREYALSATNIRKKWGAPYMLIAKLYASSGPFCGPGRGWDSQIVVWPAIDMWKKAKSVDSSVSKEATKFINQYKQYMPTNEDIFQRPTINEGDKFYVGCWIQRNTIVRAK